MTASDVMEDATWDPPGPGSWVCDRSHSGGSPTPLFRRMLTEETAPVYEAVFEELGGAVKTADVKVVNGEFYRRVVPLVGAKFDRGTLPPKPILWLVTRLHPAFRRRNKQAQITLTERPQNAHIARWYDEERESWRSANSAFQEIDLTGFDDAALAAHIRDLDAHVVSGWRRHHYLHGYDLGPIGDLLFHTEQWGFDQVEVMSLLKGDSPATTEAAAYGQTIVEALRSGGVDPTTTRTVAEVRAVPAAGEALDEYLAVYGWRLVTSYDLEGQTLGEMPAAIMALIHASAKPTTTHERDAELEARLRAASGDPDLFDELVVAARLAYGLRDDNGPLTWEWPAGLMRRAYLIAAKRLVATEALVAEEEVFELDTLEVADLLAGHAAVSRSEIEARAARRRWEAEQQGPDVLGPLPLSDPDLSAMPPALRRLMGITLVAAALLEPDPSKERRELEGLGIGDAPYQGVARVAHDPADAIAALEPGDVLVAPYTAPSYNAVLAIAGAVVVQEGGLLCHAAVMARELDLPAVIGCHGAMDAIATGDVVEVDPVAGCVRVV